LSGVVRLQTIPKLYPLGSRAVESRPCAGYLLWHGLMAHELGGEVDATKREYGQALWKDKVGPWPDEQKSWMSHGMITKAPPGRKSGRLSSSEHGYGRRTFWAVQFHPKSRIPRMNPALRTFLFDFCKAKENWNAHLITDHLLSDIKRKVQPTRAMCSVAGSIPPSRLCSRAHWPRNSWRVFGYRSAA